MSLIYEQRPSDSPYIETITYGRTTSAGTVIRPAETHWHMVFAHHSGRTYPIAVGPLTSAGIASWGTGAEILWIKFKLGTFMPHLPTRALLGAETALPEAGGRTFWLKGSAWQFPDYENADTFVARLVRQGVLVLDPLVRDVLQGRSQEIPSRTIRHRFLSATGLTQGHIRQLERAQKAAALLRQGTPVLDTVFEAGYFDQPHLTRSLKHWIGYTPTQILRSGSSGPAG